MEDAAGIALAQLIDPVDATNQDENDGAPEADKEKAEASGIG